MSKRAELEHEIVAGGGISLVRPSFFLFHDRREWVARAAFVCCVFFFFLRAGFQYSMQKMNQVKRVL